MRLATQSAGSIQRTRLLPGQDGSSLPYWWLSFERNSQHIEAPDADVSVLRDRAIAATPLRGDVPLPSGSNRISLWDL